MTFEEKQTLFVHLTVHLGMDGNDAKNIIKETERFIMPKAKATPTTTQGSAAVDNTPEADPIIVTGSNEHHAEIDERLAELEKRVAALEK